MKRTAAGAAALLLILACARKAEQAPSENHDGHGTVEEKAPTGPDVVRIDPEMLRDLRVTTMPAESRPGGEGVTMLGELRVNEDRYAEVGFPLPARVLEILVSAGDMVRRNQALARLQSVEAGKALGDYRTAEARARLARQAAERKRGLVSDRIAPVREAEEAEAEATAAEATLQAARAAMAALGISAEADAGSGAAGATVVLRSPIPGSVIERRAVRGQMTEPGSPMFRIGDLTDLWLVVHAFERDAVRIRSGSNARVSFPALPGRVFSGKVSWIGQQVDSSSRTVPVRIEIANDQGLLRPGISATAWLPLGDEGDTVVTVPIAAVQRLRDGWCVFLPHGEGEFEMRSVGRGRDLGGEVEILNGLQPGESVVVDGAFLLRAEAEKSRGEGEHHDH